MKRFEWRLQRVLDLKVKAEQLRRAELLQLGEQLAAARTALLGQQRILRDGIRQLAQREPQARMNDQALFLEHAAVNDAAIAHLQSQVDALAGAHERKAAEVLALRRDKEGLERLREKAFTEFTAEQQRQQQHIDDDRTSIDFAHRRQGDAVMASARHDQQGDRL